MARASAENDELQTLIDLPVAVVRQVRSGILEKADYKGECSFGWAVEPPSFIVGAVLPPPFVLYIRCDRMVENPPYPLFEGCDGFFHNSALKQRCLTALQPKTPLIFLARPEGFEPPTLRSEV